MTDARQLQIFVDCPYGGCEDGYCACLEQDVDPEDFEDLDEPGDDTQELYAEAAELYGLDPHELGQLDEAVNRLLADYMAGRVVRYRHRLRRVVTGPSIDAYPFPAKEEPDDQSATPARPQAVRRPA